MIRSTFAIGALALAVNANTSASLAEVSNTAALTIADLTAYPTARCLDGSGAAFYYRAGVDDDVDKWMIMLEGGGACTGLLDSVLKCVHVDVAGAGVHWR